MIRPFAPATLLTCALLAAAAGLSAQVGSAPRPILQALDKDGDGSLSAAEIQNATASLLTLDRNHDGRLTPDEYPPVALGSTNIGISEQPGRQNRLSDAAGRRSGDPIVDCLDADQDGTLSAAELASAPGALKRLDSNADGVLDPSEMRLAASAMEEAAQLMSRWDANGDGVLSRRETPGELRQNFNVIDTNHNGRLDAEELTVWCAKRATLQP